MYNGDPIHLELHSADASAGVQMTIYKAGSLTPYVLNSWEWIEVHSLELITAVGGDCFLAFDTAVHSPTPTAGTVAVRATLAANSGIVVSHMHYTAINGGIPYVVAPVGVVDCNCRAVLRATTQPGRQNFQARIQTNNPAQANQGATLS